MEVKDTHGNVLVSPGLKVRHKKSQFEYTVDNVIKDPDGDINVILKMPEEPRFEPPPEEDNVIKDDGGRNSMLYEYDVDPNGLYVDVGPVSPDEEKEPLADDELLAVPQEEFEKEYEVK